jgi:hypothetical protein
MASQRRLNSTLQCSNDESNNGSLYEDFSVTSQVPPYNMYMPLNNYSSYVSSNTSPSFGTSPHASQYTGNQLESQGVYSARQESSSTPRNTPNSLGWLMNDEYLNSYKFVVSKGKEPYFELPLDCPVTANTLATVYLDQPE